MSFYLVLMTPVCSQRGEDVKKGQKIGVILNVWPLTWVSKTQLFSYFLPLQHSREARRKMQHLVNFEQIFHKTLSERHFGIKDTPNHLNPSVWEKTNKKPSGFKIQSATSNQLHPHHSSL